MIHLSISPALTTIRESGSVEQIQLGIMGNYVSCASSKVQSNVVKVIALYGSVQQFEKPMKVAELMLDNPQHFVCHSTALENKGRISGLSADEELELGHLYFLLPMHKLHSPLSPAEMAFLTFKTDSALHKSTSKSMGLARILPVLGDLCHCSADRNLAAPDLNEEIKVGKKTVEMDDTIFMPRLHVDDADDVGEVRGLSLRFISCKYWKPALETISESPSSVMSVNLPITPLLSQPKKGNPLHKTILHALCQYKRIRPAQD